MKRIRCMLIKELTQLRRDPKLLPILIVAPLFQLLVFGYAATTDVKEIRLGVRDDDHSWHSREYARAVGASDYFRTTALTGPAARDGDLLVSGRAGLVLGIPRGFGKRLAAGEPAPVQVLVDGADSNFAVHGLLYIQKAGRLFSEKMVRPLQESAARRLGLRPPSVTVESRCWYNPDLRSQYYMVPGIMGILLLVTTMLVTSMALVKEREEGTMEQIIVPPMRPSELVAGKLLPFVVVGFIEVTVVLLAMRGVFHVPLRGSLALLYALSGLFLLTTLGLGLFISTLVRTQQQAMLVSAFFVMMPFVLLSGFIFPVENMPPAIEWISRAIPLRYYLTIVRGIFLKGTGLAELWPQALALLVWGLSILGLAILMFRKRLD